MQDADLLEAVVCEAAELALALSKKPVEHWNKAGGSPVSAADLAVNVLLQERLCSARPDYGWFSEETPDDGSRLGKDRVWIVDPIDGTRGFLGGSDRWCVAVALLERGRPIHAVIVRPTTQEVFRASAGQGATLNGARLEVSPRNTLEGARIVTSKPVAEHLEAEDNGKVQLEGMRDYPLILSLVRIAQGISEGCIMVRPKQNWDIAAGALCVSEAGGRVSDLAGKPLDLNGTKTFQNGFVASNGHLHTTFLRATE